MTIDNLDFENEFMSDEDVEEMLDNLTDLIGEQAEAEDNKNAMINPMKIKAVMYTYNVLKYMTKAMEAKVTYKLNEPYKSMGSVSVVGKDLMFGNPQWLLIASKLSSSFNVYPKTDGTIQMDFTFHGLTTTFE